MPHIAISSCASPYLVLLEWASFSALPLLPDSSRGRVVGILVQRVPATQLCQLYDIPEFGSSPDEFLSHIARKLGKLKKVRRILDPLFARANFGVVHGRHQGGLPDLNAAARLVLHDWNEGKIPFFTPPPPSVGAKPPEELFTNVCALSEGGGWRRLCCPDCRLDECLENTTAYTFLAHEGEAMPASQLRTTLSCHPRPCSLRLAAFPQGTATIVSEFAPEFDLNAVQGELVARLPEAAVMGPMVALPSAGLAGCAAASASREGGGALELDGEVTPAESARRSAAPKLSAEELIPEVWANG